MKSRQSGVPALTVVLEISQLKVYARVLVPMTQSQKVEYSLSESSNTGSTLVQCTVCDNSLKCCIARNLSEQISSRVLRKMVITSRVFNIFLQTDFTIGKQILFYLGRAVNCQQNLAVTGSGSLQTANVNTYNKFVGLIPYIYVWAGTILAVHLSLRTTRTEDFYVEPPYGSTT
jgi:hypothetical protein